MTLLLKLLAVWNERRRDPEEIDGKIRARYLANMRDAQAKNDVMFSQIRGEHTKLDSSMNNLVWGGKAKIVPPSNNNKQTPSAGSSSSSDDEESDSETEADLEDESMLGEEAASLVDLPGDSAETKRQKRKGRKRQKKEKRQKRRELKRQKKELEEAVLMGKRQEQIQQAGFAAAALGVVAVAASVLMGGSRRG